MANKIINIDGTGHRIEEQDSDSMWEDFTIEGRPFSNICMYKNDFVSWVPDEWTITEVNASTQTLLDERNGVLRLTPAGADNDGSNMQLGGTGDTETTGESFAPVAGRSKNLWFECRIRSNTDADQNDVFVGLHVEDTTICANIGSDALGFQIVDESAEINAISRSGSSTSTEAGVATAVDAEWVKLGFKAFGDDKVEFYVNDAIVATITTNIPTNLMKLSIAHLSGEASANVLDIDYIVVAQDR